MRLSPGAFEIAESEIKMALGYPKLSVIEEPIRSLVDEAVGGVWTLIDPVASIEELTISVTESVVDVSWPAPRRILSKSLSRHLAGCDRALALAATIGSRLEERVRELFEQGEFTRATVLDAVGSGAIEGFVDAVQEHLAREMARLGRALTTRYSPGYGDWHLPDQEWLVAVSGGSAIGIELTESFMMIPRKSVTALIGLRGAFGADAV